MWESLLLICTLATGSCEEIILLESPFPTREECLEEVSYAGFLFTFEEREKVALWTCVRRFEGERDS